jgi:WD40 repeat protein
VARPPREYEAFISYSHTADNNLAAALQRTLNRIARPPYKWREWWPPRVFRDQTNLAAAADLGGVIRSALMGSSSFVLLASPPAAESRWVNEEVRMWCANKPRDRLFIALTRGSLAWDEAKGDFDPEQTDAIPPALYDVFDAEPLWVDLRGVSAAGTATRDPRFLDGAATLAAAIRGTEKYELTGEDARQHKRTKRLVRSGIGLLAALTLLATVAAIYAAVQRGHANHRARLATSRQLAAEAVAKLDVDPAQSLVLAARATTTAETGEAVNSLRQALRASRLRSQIAARAPVFDVEVGPDTGLVAAALGHNTVRVWGRRTRKVVSTLRLGHSFGRVQPAHSVSFSRDGRRLLAAGPYGGAVVWSIAGGRVTQLARFDRAHPVAGSLSPDGRLAATADPSMGFARLWHAETGKHDGPPLRPPGNVTPVQDVAFDKSGSRLIGATGKFVTIWDLRTHERTVLRPREGLVWSVALSPDGHHVAAGFDDNAARIWDLRTGKTEELNGHEGAVTHVAFSPDGSLLATASQDETAGIWNVSNGNMLARLRGDTGNVESASFAPNGATVLTGSDDGTVRFWSVTADPVLAEIGSPQHASPDRDALRSIAFDPSGKRLLTAGNDRIARVWDIRSGALLRTLQNGQSGNWVESARFDATGRYVLAAGDDGKVRIWKLSTGAPPTVLGGPEGGALLAAAFSPDGRLVAVGGQTGTVRVWRWRQRKLVRTLGHPGAGARVVAGVAFSPDGRLIAAARDTTVRLWRSDDGGAVAVLTALHPLTSIAFDPTGELLAAGDASGGISLWDVATKQRLTGFTGHTQLVSGVAFSADGRYLATVGEDGVAKVWTVPGGDLVTSVRTRASRLEDAAFAPHGSRFAVARWDGRATVFACDECLPPARLVCLAARRITPVARMRAKNVFRRCD